MRVPKVNVTKWTLLAWIVTPVVTGTAVTLTLSLGCAAYSPLNSSERASRHYHAGIEEWVTKEGVVLGDGAASESIRQMREIEKFADPLWIDRWKTDNNPGPDRSSELVAEYGFGVTYQSVRMRYVGHVSQHSVYEVKAGWPLPCFIARAWRSHGYEAVRKNAIAGMDKSNSIVTSGGRVIPTQMLSGGLIGDIGIYAIVVVIGKLCRNGVLRASRKRKGLCLACGYPLRGVVGSGEPCPECGSPGVRSRVSARCHDHPELGRDGRERTTEPQHAP